MRKSTFISILALATALIGVAVTVALYVARKREQEFDEFADDLLDDDMDYFAAQVEDVSVEDTNNVIQEELEDTHPLED